MNRVIYSSNTVLVSTAPAAASHTGLFDLKLIDRVQTAQASFSTQVKRFKQIGFGDFLLDNFYAPPKISFDLSYYNSDTSNEAALGLNVNGESIFKNQATTGKDVNIFLLSDVVGNRDIPILNNFTGFNVFGIGNALLTNYSVSAGVGNIPTTQLSFEANNIVFDTFTGNNSVPALTYSGKKTLYPYNFATGVFNKNNYTTDQLERPVAIRPADIFVVMTQPQIGGGVYTAASGKIQNFDIQIPFERKELLGFGNNFAFDRKLMYPVVGTVSFNAIFDGLNNGNYSDIFNSDYKNNIDIYLNDCQNNNQIIYSIKDARLISENFNFSIGPDVNFDGSFEFSVSAEKGFSISGNAGLYDEDATAFLQAANISDTQIRTGINNFVTNLKTNGIWYKMSGIYPFVGGTAYQHKFNLKDPKDSDNSFRLGFSGAGTVHTTSGIDFAGTNDYANVFFNPYSDLTGYPVHLSFLSLADSQADSIDLGCVPFDLTSPRLLVSAEYNSPNAALFDCYDFTIGRTSISSPNSQAFYTASRINTTSGFMMLFNSSTTPTKSARTTSDISSTSKPNFDIFLGAVNKGGTPYNQNISNRKFGFFSVGDGLTSGECVNLYSAVKKLQNDLSRNSSVFI
jgi:hypothetical protein